MNAESWVEERPDPAQDRATTLRGLGVLFWILVFGAVIGAVNDALGLKYMQGVLWPTDLSSFEQLPPDPIDVAILGSSRVALGLSPDAIDGCLGQALGRPTRTVNLARAFSTTFAYDVQARELLSGATAPKVLLLGMDPESMNNFNHQLSLNFSSQGDLADIPDMLRGSHGLVEAVSALRPFTRGAESLALYLGQRHKAEARLRWLMLYHDGGQWCFEGETCAGQNRAYLDLLKLRWDLAVRERMPELAGIRFTRYESDGGLMERRLDRLVARARAQGTQVALVDMPLHEAFVGATPEAVMSAYHASLKRASERLKLPTLTAPAEALRHSRMLYLDPDHLNANGARQFSETVCHALLVDLLAPAGADEEG